MIFEMHCHTSEHSACSHVDAVSLVQRVFEKGLEGVVLTDHHYLWPLEDLEELRRRAGVPEYFIILSGQEVSSSDFGHVLVYGADRTIAEGTALSALRKEYPQAAVIWAHPYRSGYLPLPKRLLNPLLDGIEIFSTNHTVSEMNKGLLDWHTYKFTAIGGTDSHSSSYVGIYPTLFDHPVREIQELAVELRAGRCRPFFKEIPRSGTTDTQVLEVTMGTKGQDNVREKLIIKRHENPDAWKAGARTFPILEELARHSFRTGRFRAPRPLARGGHTWGIWAPRTWRKSCPRRSR